MSTLGNMSKEVVEKYINGQKYTETNKKSHKGAQ
ncbi:IS200/IS605 family transposase, partial [Limosilactobacillus fermentum]|nr:IS200/IS605 family transposase [Limosilactobacillus fermentum]